MSDLDAGLHPDTQVHLARAQICLESLKRYLGSVADAVGGQVGDHLAEYSRLVVDLAQFELDEMAQYTGEPDVEVLMDASLWLVKATLR